MIHGEQCWLCQCESTLDWLCEISAERHGEWDGEWRGGVSVVVVMQEIDEMVSRAKQVQQQVWTAIDDVTVVDDGPVEIRQLLKPWVSLVHCYHSVLSECFDAIGLPSLPPKTSVKYPSPVNAG